MATKYVIDKRFGKRGTMENWVERFIWVWEDPQDRLEELLGLLSVNVRLKAPTRPPESIGEDAARSAFNRAFRAMPDLKGKIHDWSAKDDVLFISMTFSATIGNSLVEWPNVDRFKFVDGVAVERLAHFDPSPVRRAMLGSPGAIWKLVRLRLGI